MNKITVKNLNTQYSEITVEKDCKFCLDTLGLQMCDYCEGTGYDIKKYIVPNNGWFPLKYWIDKFKNED